MPPKASPAPKAAPKPSPKVSGPPPAAPSVHSVSSGAPVAVGPPCGRNFITLPPHLYSAYATAENMCRTCAQPVHLHPSESASGASSSAAPPSAAPAVPASTSAPPPSPGPSGSFMPAGGAPGTHTLPTSSPPHAATTTVLPTGGSRSHLSASPDGAGVETVLGPMMSYPCDASSVFLRVIDSWMTGPWCNDESDRARRALQHVSVVMFGGGTAFVNRTFRVTGGNDLGRSYALMPGLDESDRSRRERGRNILLLADLAMRGIIPIARATARYRHFVLHRHLPLQRSRHAVTSEMAFFEDLASNVCTMHVFQSMPAEENWQVPEGHVWWSLWWISTAPELLRHTLERLVVRAGERYRAAHPESFCDRVVWEQQYADPGRGRRDRTPDATPYKRRRGRGRRAASRGVDEGDSAKTETPITAETAPQSTAPSSGAPPGGRGWGAGRRGRGGRGRGGRGRDGVH
jgi:hypothetical protein